MFYLKLGHGRILSTRSALMLAAATLATGCTAVGPGRNAILKSSTESSIQGIEVIELTQAIAMQRAAVKRPGFAQIFGQSRNFGNVVGPGDVLDITIWEAPPAALFGVSALQSSIETSRSTSLPEFIVGPSGKISVPFAGVIDVTNRTLPDIERAIITRLQGKAHLPQVLVRLVRNATANATVVGEVNNSARMPLTAKGETVLDALAAAGGTRQAIDKMTIQLSRGNQVSSMPLSAIVANPRENIMLNSGDIITAIFQPYSFTVLGAAGRNEEIRFEATGVTIAQALGRIGGLQDGRADPKGVFLFRWEDPSLLPPERRSGVPNANGRVPTIYWINMKDPATYLMSQNFLLDDKDVIYISNSPVAEVQRVIGLITSTVIPVAQVDTAIQN